MSVRWYSVVDCRDAAALSRWWAEVLGWRIIYEEASEVVVVPPHGIDPARDIPPREREPGPSTGWPRWSPSSAWSGLSSGMPHWPTTFEGLAGPPRQPTAAALAPTEGERRLLLSRLLDVRPESA